MPQYSRHRRGEYPPPLFFEPKREELKAMNFNNPIKTSIISSVTIRGMLLLLFLALSAASARAQIGPGEDCYRYSNANVPYGHYQMLKHSEYGRRIQVNTPEEAADIVKGFYADKKVTTGRIIEKRWFFRINVLDEASNIIDVVIVDKRNGRVRSIY